MATTTLETRATGRLAPTEELEIALRTVGNFAGSISGADTKAGLLIPVLGIGIGGAAKHAPAIHAGLPVHSPLSIAALGLFATLLGSALLGLIYLTATLTPRTGTPRGGPNLFAFPSFRARPEVLAPEDRVRVAELCAQAWRQAEALAGIATTKYRRLRNALRCSCVALLAFLAWTALMPFLPA